MEQPRKANATMVEEFYNEAPEDLSSSFIIWGVPVDISIDNIYDYYGLMIVVTEADRGMRASALNPT